ncbi:hypothetical protein LTR99_008341 [Exophiala xenobiotica]|uniref:NAD(P)-binding protein n=1 Tax=Vermiconidia calcicola TaxID=1690605 RepID=A0AAV9PRZ9_9PEZI|nr:hypothetical protein H2202_007688 [Exophiala xenobiotica]KAK5528489.1 hypothetical protein LTR25_010488 [Vermiconidia calcicola]KAK5538236.1 hypothetical protein LTR23_007024 [Chaetothyriales sp. CCFEE 6169]KAK5198694.1 hypothetical protein LTR92_001165 [Exophiala xenobiotica]KAK5209608.1 hypothetical protein LTR41_005144 [Exophiala xenobiotica]
MSAGSVVIVTGASAGIGAAIVDRLLQQDAKVVLVDIAEEPLKNRQAKHGAGSVQYVVGDVSKDETNFQAIKIAIDTWGKLDALALNAGIMAPVKRLCDVSSSEWTRIFNINVVSQISMLQSTIPHLRNSKGKVIFTSSDAGEKPTFAAWGAYGATKAAVNYLIKVLTLEEPDITAIGLYPGVVNTPLVQGIFKGDYDSGMSAEELQTYTDFVKPKLVEPHQPGSVIANLALDAPRGLRGEILFWDDEKFSAYR